MIKGSNGGVREGPGAGCLLLSHPIDTSWGGFYEGGGKKWAAPGNSAGKPDTHLGGGGCLVLLSDRFLFLCSLFFSVAPLAPFFF